MASDSSDNFRPEARAVPLWGFDKERKNALEKIVQKMHKARENIKKGAVKKTPRSTLYFPEKPEYSNVIFISGQRGVGKTSLLYSLISAFGYCISKNSPNCWNKVIKDGACEGKGTFCEKINSLKGDIILLKPLELESMHGPANLLASIFARLNDAIKRVDDDPVSGLFDASQRHSYLSRESGYHDAIMEFQRLQKDVSIAWGGNLPERAARIDPDVFAVESLRAENARIDLNRRFNKVLDDLAKQIFCNRWVEEPLFVLPVDDFDLNPKRYIEMLRLLDLVPSTRLFIILLGNIYICRRLLYLKVLNDFRSFQNGKEGTILPPEKYGFEEGLAQQIAAHTLRKYIPPGNIVLLKPFIRKKDKKIAKPDKPNKGTGIDLNMAAVMRKIIVLMKREYMVEVKTIKKYIQLMEFLRIEEEDNNTFALQDEKSYANPLFFHLPYRHRYDLLMKMR